MSGLASSRSLAGFQEELGHFEFELRNFENQLEKLRVKAQVGRFLLTERTMLRHLLVLGSTGSGKTNHTFNVVKAVAEKNAEASIVVIDGKREYRKLGKVIEGFDGRVAVFEIGEVDSLRDQAFLAELLLLYLWQHDRAFVDEGEEKLRRLVVVEEAHRYLSEERPPEKRGERTLLELALAEARRYGWGFVIVDQLPNLLSRYVWDNAGTVIVHRLSNLDSYQTVKKALGLDPVSRGEIEDRRLAPLLLSLPEEFAVYRKYVGGTSAEEAAVGVLVVPKMGPTST